MEVYLYIIFRTNKVSTNFGSKNESPSHTGENCFFILKIAIKWVKRKNNATKISDGIQQKNLDIFTIPIKSDLFSEMYNRAKIRLRTLINYVDHVMFSKINSLMCIHELKREAKIKPEKSVSHIISFYESKYIWDVIRSYEQPLDIIQFFLHDLFFVSYNHAVTLFIRYLNTL